MFGNRFCAGVAVAVLAGQVVTAASVPAYAVAVPGGQSLRIEIFWHSDTR